MTRDKFIAGMREARDPTESSRREARAIRALAQYAGRADGDYVIIEYTAKFAKGKMSEHLVWTLEDGAIWRVAGYNYR